jgi:hypothetical protein
VTLSADRRSRRTVTEAARTTRARLSRRAHEQHLTDSSEAQAYLVLLIVPMIALLGAVTGAATLGLRFGRSRGLVMVAAPGWLMLLGVVGLSVAWAMPSRPGHVTVRNESTVSFRNVYLGSDYRRSTRIGFLRPGETSGALQVDLDNPHTFDALAGESPAELLRQRLSAEATTALTGLDYQWVVSGSDGALTFRFEPAR